MEEFNKSYYFGKVVVNTDIGQRLISGGPTNFTLAAHSGQLWAASWGAMSWEDLCEQVRAKNEVPPPSYSRSLYEALKDAGADVVEYEDVPKFRGDVY